MMEIAFLTGFLAVTGWTLFILERNKNIHEVKKGGENDE